MDVCQNVADWVPRVDEWVKEEGLMLVLAVQLVPVVAVTPFAVFPQSVCNQICTLTDTQVPAGQHTFLKCIHFSSAGSLL